MTAAKNTDKLSQDKTHEEEVYSILQQAGKPLATTEVAERWTFGAKEALAVLTRLEKARRVRTGKRGTHRGGKDQNAYLCSARNYGWRYWATQEIAEAWPDVLDIRKRTLEQADATAVAFRERWEQAGGPMADRMPRLGERNTAPHVRVVSSYDMETISVEIHGMTPEQFQWLYQQIGRKLDLVLKKPEQ